MHIEVSLDNLLKYGSAARGSWEKELNPSPEESEFLERVLPLLPADSVTVERRSDDYLSLICNEIDFLRFKLSSRTKWLSLNLPKDLKKEYKESALFRAQEKKTAVHWKSVFTDMSDIDVYRDLIIASCRNAMEL